MNNPLDSSPPCGSIPFRDAIKQFMPAEMWDEYARTRAVYDQRDSPKRSAYWLLSVGDWVEAKAASRGSSQAPSARAELDRAWTALLSAMKLKFETRELAAFAQDDPPFGPWRMIPASAWRQLRITNIEKGKAKVGAKEIYDIHVLPSDNDDHMPTGMPGRKTKGADLILEEFLRLVAAGERKPTIRAQSILLEKWHHDTYPQRQHPTAKTIENFIRMTFWSTAPRKN